MNDNTIFTNIFMRSIIVVISIYYLGKSIFSAIHKKYLIVEIVGYLLLILSIIFWNNLTIIVYSSGYLLLSFNLILKPKRENIDMTQELLKISFFYLYLFHILKCNNHFTYSEECMIINSILAFLNFVFAYYKKQGK